MCRWRIQAAIKPLREEKRRLRTNKPHAVLCVSASKLEINILEGFVLLSQSKRARA
jgi:hypothetical protein